MSISSELTNLQQDITNARTQITTMGGQTTPSGGSSQLAVDIATIPTGGGGSKYGATINGIFGDTNASGVYSNPTEDLNIDFTGVTSFANDVQWRYRFYNATNLKSVNFQDLTSLPTYALYYAFYGATNLHTINLQSLTSITANACQYFCRGCTSLTSDINLNSLTTISGTRAFDNAFNATNIVSFSCNGLTTIAGTSTYTFNYCLYGCGRLKRASFSGLTSINANSAFQYAFTNSGADNTEANKLVIDFSNLETIGNTAGTSIFASAFQDAQLGSYFYGYRPLHQFPKLKSIDGNTQFQSAYYRTSPPAYVFDSLETIGTNRPTATNQVFVNAFTYCYTDSTTSPTVPDYKRGLFFPALKTIGASGATGCNRVFQGVCQNTSNTHTAHFYELTNLWNNHTTSSYGHFYNCGLTKVYMPKLTNMGSKPEYTFYSSSTITELHFGIENQATIQAMTGYSSKFGASSATIYFDMVNHITYDGVVYDRDGAKCDIDNWYFAYTNGDNTIYVKNHNNPAVGDTVCTKSGSTYTSAGTVEAVA